MVLSARKAVDVGSSIPSTLGRLRLFVAGLSTSFGVELPSLPELPSVGAVKEFCSGLQENPNRHPWGEHFRRLPDGKAFSLAHSLFLFRKVIPACDDPDALSDAYVRRMCSVGAPTDSRYLEFVKREIPRLFPRGWDRRYRGKARRLLLPVKAVIEAGRRRGGGRSLNAHLPYLRRVALGWEVPEHVDTRARVSCVRDGCKLRVVTASSVDQHALSPLHEVMYDHLSTHRWLQRGDATPRSFPDFCKKQGEVFVSGDYESATDNLSLEVYQQVLASLALTSESIPRSVFGLAQQRSVNFIYSKKFCGVQRRGQLMGTYVSFPILCLANYMAFRYLVPREGVPVKVNGDDIVFRATPEEAKVWAAGVGGAGLVLSRGKTLVRSEFFTLNSTPFRASVRKVRLVPFVRARAVFTTPETPAAMTGQYAALAPGLSGPGRRLWQVLFLRQASSQVWVSQRSLTRGLGMRVSVCVLRQTGLFRRERFYLAAPKEPPLPTIAPPGCAQTAFPGGFSSFSRDESGLTKGRWRAARDGRASFMVACRLHAQCLPRAPSCEEWKGRLQAGTERYWEPKRKIRTLFSRVWARFALPFKKPTTPGRPIERLVLPVGPWVQGGRGGLGLRRQPLVDGL